MASLLTVTSLTLSALHCIVRSTIEIEDEREREREHTIEGRCEIECEKNNAYYIHSSTPYTEHRVPSRRRSLGHLSYKKGCTGVIE